MNKTANMHVVIAAVGRSGSKLLQLATSYIVADACGALDVNYEPLLWRYWDSMDLNQEGMAVHKDLPLFGGATASNASSRD